MEAPLQQRTLHEFPALLREINDPPKLLYVRGTLPPDSLIFLAVVGSRKYTPYGKEVTSKLLSGLRGYPICIVSGLALGIDALSHEAALAAGLITLAIPGSGLSDRVLYPRSHVRLAHRILEAGGALASEFGPDHEARPENFPQRNRIMAGLSHAILVIEAEEKSGTLITARLAMEYNRDVLTVPGSIFSSQSRGNHYLIRNGATPITTATELLEALGFEQKDKRGSLEIPADCSVNERRVLELLSTPLERDVLTREARLETSEIGAIISLLEIKGLVKEVGGFIWRA